MLEHPLHCFLPLFVRFRLADQLVGVGSQQVVKRETIRHRLVYQMCPRQLTKQTLRFAAG